MKIRLFFTFILLLLSVNVYCDCEDIAENIASCEKYFCLQHIDDKNYIEHEILGLNSDNLCVYKEKRGEDEMICYHSKHGMMMEKKYFENIFKIDNQETVNFFDIANLRAKECFLFNSHAMDSRSQNYIMKEAVDNNFGLLSQHNDVQSIFFDERVINNIIHEVEKFNTRSSTNMKDEEMNNFDCRIVRLDSIIYVSTDIWKIWVNGKQFTNKKDLKVLLVTEDYVMFIWNIEQAKIQKKFINSKKVSVGHESIMFTLHPKQKFNLDNLSIE